MFMIMYYILLLVYHSVPKTYASDIYIQIPFKIIHNCKKKIGINVLCIYFQLLLTINQRFFSTENLHSSNLNSSFDDVKTFITKNSILINYFGATTRKYFFY